jgi:hypothetical protein
LDKRYGGDKKFRCFERICFGVLKKFCVWVGLEYGAKRTFLRVRGKGRWVGLGGAESAEREAAQVEYC